MKLLNFTIIKLTLFLILGIVIGNNFDIGFQQSLIYSIALLIVTGIGIFITITHFRQNVWIGILICLTTISIGVSSVNIHQELNFKNHYTKYQSANIDAVCTINFRIREILKPSIYYNKYVIDILEINNEQASGKALLNVEKDSTLINLKVDDILTTISNFKEINPNLNPYQFNYKNHLHKKYIYHQLSVTKAELLKLQTKKQTLCGYASLLRERINNNLKKYGFKDDELAIINALLLGQRQDISKEIYDSYSQAGTIHILAVSGLHIGIILLLLNYLFKPLEFFRKGKFLKIIIIVILLWGFAIIAGLSASVVRAVTMFTIIAIGMNLKRPTNIYNTLAISMFILLLIKPNFLFDVGFQLSYLAVIAIVTIQPILYNLWIPKLKILNFFWNVLTVTIAAQVGVIPLSLYYFHQFPGLFFVSNLVIIPALGFILGLGIIIILLSMLNILPFFLANVYGSIISFMNSFVAWVSHQEGFLFKNISFGIVYVMLSYLLITSIILVTKKRTFNRVIVALLSVLLFQGYLIFEKSQTSNTFIVFHKTRHCVIGMQHNQKMTLHHNLKDSIFNNDNIIANYEVGEAIVDLKTDNIQSLYQQNNKIILVVDSLGIYNMGTFKPNIVLLRNSPKINLRRLIDSLQPELIISDGSNFKSYEERWSLTCNVQKTPFHQTSKKGAFIYSY